MKNLLLIFSMVMSGVAVADDADFAIVARKYEAKSEAVRKYVAQLISGERKGSQGDKEKLAQIGQLLADSRSSSFPLDLYNYGPLRTMSQECAEMWIEKYGQQIMDLDQFAEARRYMSQVFQGIVGREALLRRDPTFALEHLHGQLKADPKELRLEVYKLFMGEAKLMRNEQKLEYVK